MSRLIRSLLFTLRMEINSTYGAGNLVETYVVKPLKACAHYFPNSMIRYQEILFPPHEHIFSLSAVLVVKIWLLCLLSQRTPCWKLGPVLHVGLICCTPGLVFGLKSIFGPDNLALEVSRQGRMVNRKA